jgi:site-specific DNA recombinase
MRTKAIIYSRVSIDKQALDGIGLDVQKSKCEDYIKSEDYELIGSFSDKGKSGKSLEGRDGLEKAIKLAKKHKGVIVIYSLSRLSRSMLDTLTVINDLDKKDVGVASVTEKIDTKSSCGRFQFYVMSALNQLQREQISENTKNAMQQLKAEGKRYSTFADYGYKHKNGKLVEDKKEQQILNFIVKSRASGIKLKDIANELSLKGMFTRKNTPFQVAGLSRLLRKNKS